MEAVSTHTCTLKIHFKKSTSSRPFQKNDVIISERASSCGLDRKSKFAKIENSHKIN